MKKYKLKKSVIATMLTVLVIFSLLMAGPASAVTLNIDGIADVAENSTEEFVISVDIADGERVPLDNVTLTIGDKSCVLSPSGSELSGTLCQYITVTSLNRAGYATGTGLWGYGYGYNVSGGVYEYINHTFSDGFGYGYTSGYNYVASTTYGEVAMRVTFDPWSVSSDTTYAVSVKASADEKVYRVKDASTITVTNVAGGGGSSGSSSSSVAPATPTYEQVEDADEKEGIATDLGLDLDGVNAIYKQKAIEEFTKEGIEQALEVASEKAKPVLQALLDKVNSGEGEQLKLKKTLEKFKVYNNDGTQDRYSRVVISLEGMSGEVEIVEVIPKSVAQMASDLQFSIAPEVIDEDPVVKWTLDSGAVSEVSYTVKKELYGIDSKTYAVSEKAETTSTTDTTGDSTVGTNEPPTQQDDGASSATRSGAKGIWTAIWIILALVIVVAVVVVIVKKKN